MVTQAKAKRSAYGLKALIVLPLFLSGCLFGEQQQFFSDPNASGGPTGGFASTPTPYPSPGGVSSALAHQEFDAARTLVRKVDFLFVVDNSGSMQDNQQKLAEGFAAFANYFYRRADLDICTRIITTDRYLGRTNGNYQRERTIACTKPAGSENWTPTQMNNHINALIDDFKNKVNVGTHGNGTELPGKSLVTFLYDLNNWNSTINPAVRTTFFRQDAVANISIVTDENNWFYNDPNRPEVSNDLPPVQNATIYNDPQNRLDVRKGIKNHMDDFFALHNPSVGLSYSVTALLELQQPNTMLPGIAMNINPLVELVGRESARGDLAGSVADFQDVYDAIGDAIVIRANAFSLSHDIFEPTYPNLADLTVNLIRADGSSMQLAHINDFVLAAPNGVILKAAVANALQPGDVIAVDYRYVLP